MFKDAMIPYTYHWFKLYPHLMSQWLHLEEYFPKTGSIKFVKEHKGDKPCDEAIRRRYVPKVEKVDEQGEAYYEDVDMFTYHECHGPEPRRTFLPCFDQAIFEKLLPEPVTCLHDYDEYRSGLQHKVDEMIFKDENNLTREEQK